MNRFTLPVVIGLILAFVMTSQAEAQRRFRHSTSAIERGSLAVNIASGRAPLTVQLTGPEKFMRIVRAYKGSRYRMGCPYTIDWGDGKHGPVEGARARNGSHTYTVPGVYTIRAALLRWHPNDSTSRTWVASCTVRVGQRGLGKRPHLKVLKPKGKLIMPFEQFPRMELDMRTNRRSNLLVELITEDGIVLGQNQRKNISYSDPKMYFGFRPYDLKVLHKLLRKSGKLNCRYRLQLKDLNGRILASAESPEFVLTSQLSKGMSKLHSPSTRCVINGGRIKPINSGSGGRVLPAIPKSSNPLEITLRYIARHRHGFSYEIDWGDGSKPQRKITPINEQSGLLDKGHVYLRHVYPKPGRYTVKMRTNNNHPLEPLSKRFAYEKLEVNVGS